jgi:cation transport ATPase
MGYIAAIVCAALTLIMSVLHIALLLGAPLGEYVLGGTDKIIPLKKRWFNLMFAVLFLFIAMLYFRNIDILEFDIPNLISEIIMVIYTVFLGYAIIGNSFWTKSKKERYLMAPLSAIGFISSLLAITYVK